LEIFREESIRKPEFGITFLGHGGHGKDGKVRKNMERIRVVRETCTEPVEASVSKDFDNFLSRIDVKESDL